MKGFVNAMAVCIVIALAFWAYAENHRTQTALREVRALNSQITAAHARIRMLNAEWAYLNRPERLRDLAYLNFDRLGLFHLSPDAFGRVDEVAHPPPLLGSILGATDVTNLVFNPDEEPL